MSELTPSQQLEACQRKLIKAEADAYLYRSLIDQSNDAIYLAYMKSRRFIHVNARFVEMFGVTLEQINTQSFDLLSRAAPESIPFLEARRAARLRGEELSPYYEFTAFNSKGQRVEVEVTVSYVTYTGEMAVQGILRDVTERKQAEANLRRHATELQVILDISAMLRQAETVDEILTIVLKKIVTVFGCRASSFFLYSEQTGRLAARAWYPLDAYEQPVSQASNEGITGYVFTTGQIHVTQNLHKEPNLYIPEEEVYTPVKHIVASISLPLRSKDKVLGVWHIGFANERELPSDEVYVLSAVAEIVGSALARATLLHTLEQRVAQRTRQLEAANYRLQELDRLKSQFVADVSHELRTPITNLKLYLDLFEQGATHNKEHYLSVIKKQTNRLETLIQSVLRITHLDMSKHSSAFTPVTINVLVKQVVDAYQHRAENAGLSLTFQPATVLPQINGIKEQLQQMFSALIANAISYTPTGSVTITTFLANERYVCVRVQDTGMGIDPEELPYLFDRFYRGQRVSQLNIPGTGLGLSLVKEIIDIHEGEIGLQSHNGEGSTVDIFLPAVPDHT